VGGAGAAPLPPDAANACQPIAHPPPWL